ncbi:histone acetyltransferases subunit 3-domain-containing protein [Ephemerocybe angulata]|uniref:Histone acetyltransferases subunit 3-domain-containing protein n=1 Tax=Ephemerocybe angulata TaxID=980116 RepID=A0A8H6I761_9AGAR|nr:histone acetyltransferases subunit 3-domain-containing protein [Tulosesus angulatus]
MTSKLLAFSPPKQIRSSLLRNPPEGSTPIPSIEEHETLLAELKALKKSAAERSKKASDDLRTIQDSMRRLKEKEKGKAKAVEKVKRERDFTPLPNDESRSHLSGPKPRLASSIPPSGRNSVDPRRSALDEKKLLKKRKHVEVDPGESDGNHTQRARKASPAVAIHASSSATHKPQKHPPPQSISHAKASTIPDFSKPVTHELLPPRPPISQPPVPGPSKPIEVMADFSKLKQPPQTQISTFYSSIEPYLRPIREEDVGFLEYTGDEVEPFIMPKLGVHYTEVWEEQDANGYVGTLAKTKEAPASAFVAPKPTWDPSSITDGDLLSEDKGHGPLTERVISALLPIRSEFKGVKAAEDAMEGRPGGSGAAAARRERLNVSDLESRIRDTMRYHGLLDDTVPDFSEKVDDPIATALRQAQQELRTVLATNKARKERLAAIARDRLGYQEYLESRDALDKAVTNLYSKLQKKDVPKLSKKKKKPLAGAAAASAAAAAANAEAENGGGVPPPCPAAVGLTPDENNHLTVTDQLKTYVETRRQWVEQVGSVFDDLQRQNPGRIWGFPSESIYQGVEEDVREKLLQEPLITAPARGSGHATSSRMVNGNGNPRHVEGKGKGRALPDDAMDIG